MIVMQTRKINIATAEKRTSGYMLSGQRASYMSYITLKEYDGISIINLALNEKKSFLYLAYFKAYETYNRY